MKTVMRLFLFGCMMTAFSMTGCSGEQKSEATVPEKFEPAPAGDSEKSMEDMKLDTV